MPFTPFHMGPGAAIKAVCGKYFSLMVFGSAQVMIDIEPLIRILRGDSVVHGLSHTYLGAFLIGAFSLVAGKLFCAYLLRVWNFLTKPKYLRWLNINGTISWLSAATGAFIGTFSHVLLDSVIHADVRPFAPFITSNELLDFLPAGWIYLFCVFLGIFGLFAMALIFAWKKWSIEI